MIVIDHLTKRFGKHTVLNNLSLEFRPGTVTAIIGPNGSGKSTLMKCILGLVKPTEGSVVINGFNALTDVRCHADIGYMAQIARYPDNLKAREVIDMVKGLRERTADTSDTLINAFDLKPHLNKPMRTLSGGTRQKVGAVVALMFSPHSLLLDEPTAGLDPVASQQMKDQIEAAKIRGAAVIITSHIIAEIEELADRAVFLHEGMVIHEGSVSSIRQQLEVLR
ncbi:MAG: ABC transporter ATP-binding protein [Ignavibacteria bacterium]|nr:ABC transporter ATP-binding protein [Ignavibacteria bacterium]